MVIDQIIFATGNEGKMGEIRAILADSGWEILSMKDAGLEADTEEDGATFEENALIKAKAAAALLASDRRKKTIVLADDSGLEIDYLNKEPGIYSARYAGVDTSYDVKNQLLLDRLRGVPEECRTARFVCAIAAILPHGENVVVRGTVEGVIAQEPAGENGFGYDPIFCLPEYGLTTAQLPTERKNGLSHRGRALRAMQKELLQR